MRYVQINEHNLVVGILHLKDEVNDKSLINTPSNVDVKLGQLYDPVGESFSFVSDLRPSIIVSTTPAAVNNRVAVAEGTMVSLSIEVKDSNGNTLPLTETFAVPVRRIGGAVERTVGISFTDGQASKDITWPSSGEFEITEDLINMHLPPEQHFKFDRLVFSVYE